jgi:hypothetical protein
LNLKNGWRYITSKCCNSLKTAEVWTKNHRDNLELDGSKKSVNSYLIPKETLEMVLKLGTSKVRAYIGLTDKMRTP